MEKYFLVNAFSSLMTGIEQKNPTEGSIRLQVPAYENLASGSEWELSADGVRGITA